MTETKSEDKAAAPVRVERKRPLDWAGELGTEPASVAGLMVFRKWDRDPAKVVTKEEFEKAVTDFEGLTFGDTETKPKPADDKKAKGA